MSIHKRVVYEGQSVEVFEDVKAALDNAGIKYHVRAEGKDGMELPRVMPGLAASATGVVYSAPAVMALYIHREGEECIHEVLVSKEEYEKAEKIVEKIRKRN